MPSLRKIITGLVLFAGPLSLLGYFLFQFGSKLERGEILLQKLAQAKKDPWQTGPLAGKASLVTRCAKGDDAACDEIVSEPGAVGALQTIDLQNPQGFAVLHPHRAASLARVAKPAAKAQGGGMLAEAERDLKVLSREVEHFVGLDDRR